MQARITKSLRTDGLRISSIADNKFIQKFESKGFTWSEGVK